jgi:hypothetical protein
MRYSLPEAAECARDALIVAAGGGLKWAEMG